MSDYINTSKEIFCGDRYFKEHVMPPNYNWRLCKKELSPYFASHGFKVSMMYSDFYSRFSGVASDRYASMDLVYFYYIPCLNRRDFTNAYTDKNLFSILFSDILQPETVVKCMNGICFDYSGRQISLSDAVFLVTKEASDLIIKPTIKTSGGKGVRLLRDRSYDLVTASFSEYGGNFIVQRKMKSHEAFSRFNPTSFNTLRILTYRDVDKKVHWLNNVAHIRIGGSTSVVDNLSSGGVTCHVQPNGILEDKCVRYKSLVVDSMKRIYGVENYTIPKFKEMVDFAVALHSRLPYFDFIGWDIGLSADGHPVFLEYNILPGAEGPQMTVGPLFGEFLDEVIDRVKRVRQIQASYRVNIFSQGFDHVLQTAGTDYEL